MAGAAADDEWQPDVRRGLRQECGAEPTEVTRPAARREDGPPAGTTLEAAVSATAEALGAQGDVIGDSGADLRFEPFHAANRICSRKVRTVLAHHAIGCRSRLMNIFAGQTYFPSHVRLRMMGCRHFGLPLVTTHTGSTSVSGGCDPAVVPTLVDWQAGEAMVDSQRICNCLDSLVDEPRRLRPARLIAAIDAEIDVIDHLPNCPMLAGRPPGQGHPARHPPRPRRRRVRTREGQALRDLHGRPRRGRDPGAGLCGEAVRGGPGRGAALHGTGHAVRLRQGRRRLRHPRPHPGLARDAVAVRGGTRHGGPLLWGAAALWEGRGLHSIERYLRQAGQLPLLRTAVIEWPGALY